MEDLFDNLSLPAPRPRPLEDPRTRYAVNEDLVQNHGLESIEDPTKRAKKGLPAPYDPVKVSSRTEQTGTDFSAPIDLGAFMRAPLFPAPGPQGSDHYRAPKLSDLDLPLPPSPLQMEAGFPESRLRPQTITNTIRSLSGLPRPRRPEDQTY